MEDYNGRIAAVLKQNESDVSGIADMSLYARELVGLDPSVKSQLPRAVVFGLSLSRGVLNTVLDGPNQLYLHHYRQLNYRLDIIAYKLSREIERQGFTAMPFPASQVIDWQKQQGHISHKHVGTLAGIGWIGRNNLLVNPDFGSQMRYNTVLTDMPLVADKPAERDCGGCTACLNSCPAAAIGETPALFEHVKCYEMLSKFRKERNIGHHICGICVSACRGIR